MEKGTSDLEPMGVREALNFGFSELAERRRERKAYEDSRPKGKFDRIVPGGPALPSYDSPGLKEAVKVAYQTKQRGDGKPYDKELLQIAETRQSQQSRFVASKWSKLFPKLKVVKTDILNF